MMIAILLAGGIGSRLQSTVPKQYIPVNTRPIFSYALETLAQSESIDAIQIVAKENWHALITSEVRKYQAGSKFLGFSLPGENRQLSIYQAMVDLQPKVARDDYVLIHDAVRPFLSLHDIEQYVAALSDYDGVIPVLPLKDTVYLSADGQHITGRLNRAQLVSGQAPEIFHFQKYLQANEALIQRVDQQIASDSPILQICGSTEVAILAGMKMKMVAGNEQNVKITTLQDLQRWKECAEDEYNEGLDFKINRSV